MAEVDGQGTAGLRIGPSPQDLVAAGAQQSPLATNSESEQYSQRTQLAKVEALELENKQLRDDIQARKGYAGKIFILICFWLAAVLAIVSMVGLKLMVLSDGVLIALITTTTINVLGLFLVVANYLFYRQKSDSPKEAPKL